MSYNRLKVRKYYEDKEEWIHIDIGSLNELSIYTGYKDKDETEVYSGDRFNFTKGDVIHTGEIKYSLEKGFWIKWDQMAYRNDVDFWFTEYKDNIKITGNIWGVEDGSEYKK